MFHVDQNVSIEIVALLLRGDSHPRKLAKDLGVSHTTVLRKLKGLLDGNVVDFRTEGKNRVFFLKKTIEARVQVYVVEWYALTNLIEEAPHLRFIIRVIQERGDIPLAVIFGSYAKGTANRRSDIDLYIETDNRMVKQELERYHSNLSVKVGPWDPENLLIQEIVKNHVILKGVERFYEKTKFFEQTLPGRKDPDRYPQRSGPGSIPEEVGELSRLGKDPARKRAA
ncbi:nucleotidyltransferase domain-containing protein [Methanoculleus sp.]|uniref:nucleotidyltransferase domain-containing protein n=1 Tax=Methanoculleus sp. TaxID=90427 RepID=UPI002FC6CD71